MQTNRAERAGIGTRVALGALAGLTGAAWMDLIRFVARRSGAIHRRVPDQVELSLVARVRGRLAASGGDPATHALLERVLHLGYGAVLGGLYGAIRRRPTLPSGAVFGVATWLFGSGFLLPAIGAGRSPWRARVSENAVNVTAHLLFGIGTAIGLGELRSAGAAAPAHPHARVG